RLPAIGRAPDARSIARPSSSRTGAAATAEPRPATRERTLTPPAPPAAPLLRPPPPPPPPSPRPLPPPPPPRPGGAPGSRRRVAHRGGRPALPLPCGPRRGCT